MTLVITGASRGIGKFLASHYEAQGHQVVKVSRSLGVDVTDEVAVRALFDSLTSVDVLINNAGVASMNHTLLTPISTAQRVMDTNFMGTLLFCREVARKMRRGGRIVNFTSIARPLNLEGEAVYAASKAAVETLTKVIAKELSTFGITVNCVGPNPIPTDLTSSIPTEKMDALLKKQAIKQMGSFEDVLNVVDFFLQPKSNMVTGQVIYLGGV